MRKMLVIIALVLMCGCSAESNLEEPKDAYCDECHEYFAYSQVIQTLGELVCKDCLVECEYRTCHNCGGFYGRDWFDCFDGYCAACSEVETWSCAYCEDRRDVRDMTEIDPGYFLCADCLLERALELDTAFLKKIPDYTEIFVSRNDRLAEMMVESVRRS